MCHLFLQVAKIYVEAKTKEASEIVARSSQPGFYGPASSMSDTGSGGFNANTLTQFDPYLSALGLVPASAWPMASTFPAMPPGMDNFMQGMDGNVGNHNTVQDWFSGSRYIMGLMEDDINMPDLNL
jgi:hypothetical protein